MDAVAGSIHNDYDYRKLAVEWRRRGKNIETMQDQTECYFLSVTVVQIPIKGCFIRIYDHIGKLYSNVVRQCQESHHKKRKWRMLCGADELQVYLQSAFSHFSRA
jgi:hypothetical protein